MSNLIPCEHSDTVGRSRCLPCRRLRWRSAKTRDTYLRYRYGITASDYDALLAKQDGGCAVCGEPGTPYLHVDHNHLTKAVRGLLCLGCNTALGQLREDVNRLDALREYLTRE